MNICLFEDQKVQDLTPIALCRPAYGITCGSLRLVDLAKRLPGKLVGGFVRPHLVDFEQDYFVPAESDSGKQTLWLNARLVPDANLLKGIASICDQPSCIVEIGDEVAFAKTAPGTTLQRPVASALRNLNLTRRDVETTLFEWPYQVIESHTHVTKQNLLWRISSLEGYERHDEDIYIRGDVTIHPMAVFDVSRGPILLEDGVTIGPFAVLQGPIHLAEKTRVVPHALLKGPISVGHTCKVGGEISSSVIEPFSNKCHFGYLGTSYVGSWVNLGAGTTNSNLKNTYGTIRLEVQRWGEEPQKIDTGLQFLGCVIGDYTKTAIHTSIYTGKTIGVCSNIYGTVTQNVPSFANYAKSFGEVTEHSADVMLVTQRRVFDRRKVQQEPRHQQLIRDIYELEAPKRKLANQPPSL